jgi:hypothetical protein
VPRGGASTSLGGRRGQLVPKSAGADQAGGGGGGTQGPRARGTEGRADGPAAATRRRSRAHTRVSVRRSRLRPAGGTRADPASPAAGSGSTVATRPIPCIGRGAGGPTTSRRGGRAPAGGAAAPSRRRASAGGLIGYATANRSGTTRTRRGVEARDNRHAPHTSYNRPRRAFRAARLARVCGSGNAGRRATFEREKTSRRRGHNLRRRDGPSKAALGRESPRVRESNRSHTRARATRGKARPSGTDAPSSKPAACRACARGPRGRLAARGPLVSFVSPAGPSAGGTERTQRAQPQTPSPRSSLARFGRNRLTLDPGGGTRSAGMAC